MICLPLLVQAEELEKNYCHETATWTEWDAIIDKHPGDMGLQALHALRIGLCKKVERGNLTVTQATTIFEDIRKALIEQRMQEQKDEKPAL